MPGRSLLLLNAIQQQLLADEAAANFAPPRGGLGGGFKLHHGRLPSEPPVQSPRASPHISAAAERRRRPLYVANNERSRTTTLENVMNQRADRLQQPSPDPAPALVIPARPASYLFAEIDAAHEHMRQSQFASPRGVTSSAMHYIGGGGSRIDHGRRKGQLSARLSAASFTITSQHSL